MEAGLRRSEFSPSLNSSGLEYQKQTVTSMVSTEWEAQKRLLNEAGIPKSFDHSVKVREKHIPVYKRKAKNCLFYWNRRGRSSLRIYNHQGASHMPAAQIAATPSASPKTALSQQFLNAVFR